MNFLEYNRLHLLSILGQESVQILDLLKIRQMSTATSLFAIVLAKADKRAVR